MPGVELAHEELAAFAELIHDLACSTNADDARYAAARHVVALLRADHFASYCWDGRRGCYTEPVAINQDPANLARYLSWYQFRDPLTPRLRRRTVASRTQDVMTQQELVRTEFYADFLRRDGMHHGVNLFVTDGGRHLADLRVWRASGRPPFTDRDLTLLDAAAPHLRRAFLRVGPRASAALPTLTPRERQVAELAAQGLTDRAIAAHLEIGFSTVRTHLSRALDKLGAANRAALAAIVAHERR